tara:strand:+ start:668 stop:1258 length:591 start_codon:yes stop_codon:yes gene_type:complete
MTNKNIAKFAVPFLMVVTLTECGVILSSDSYDNYDQTVQTLEVPTTAVGVFQITMDEPRYLRVDAEIVEVAPWLNPENKHNKISDTELVAVLKDAGFSGYGLRMAWAIVQKESTSRLYAHNRNRSTGDNSYGLFQINMIDSIGTSRLDKFGLNSNEDLFSPEINARVAFEISNGGLNWSAWTTHNKASEIINSFPG